MLATMFDEIDADRTLSVRQREAVKAAWSMSKIGEDTAGLKSDLKELAEVFDAALSETRKAFRSSKTQENYDGIINRFLHDIGEPFGIDMVGGTYVKKNGREIVGACLNGEELWAAVKNCDSGSVVKWLPEVTDAKMPDMLVDGRAYEIKTPKSMRKIRKLANEASEKTYGVEIGADGSKNVIVSLINVGDDKKESLREMAAGFVSDGTIELLKILTI